MALTKILQAAKSDPMASVRLVFFDGGTSGSISYWKNNDQSIVNLAESWDIYTPNSTMEEAAERLLKRITELA